MCENVKNKKNGFTLVELLAVIVILAIILVIAVPKVMSVIEDSKKATLEASAKMIASQAEKQKVQNTLLGNDGTITCEDITNINDVDYEDCDIDFDDNTAKVTIKGSGKFEGLYVCNGTKTTASATNESCTLVALTVDTDGGTETTYNAKYEAGSTVTLNETTKEGYEFKEWIVESGEGAIITGSTLKMGTTATKVKATWEVEKNFSTDSWETIVTAVKQAETNGTEYPYNIGDEKSIDLGTTLGTHTIRVANKTKCSAVSVTSKTACGFVLEFADIITTYNMNPAGEYYGTQYDYGTNLGGWPASKMRTYVNSDIYNALPEALRNGIIDTYVISSHGSEIITGYENVVDGNFYSTDKLYLLSTYEVWGSNSGGYDTSATNTITRQLDYYANYKGVDLTGAEYTGVSTRNYAGAIKYSGNTASRWWLRSARSDASTSFYGVLKIGDWCDLYSYSSYGVSPAFRLAN